MAWTASYYHYDGLGSTRQLTDANQNVTDSYTYRAYGELIAVSGTTVNPFHWVGRQGYYYDADPREYYVRARHYSPGLARWLSQDPLVYHDGPNPFRYALGNPIRYLDSRGYAASAPGPTAPGAKKPVGDLKKCCCPLAKTKEVPAKCWNPKLLTKAQGCKYNDNVCFTICDTNGTLHSWPISCVCKWKRWDDTDKMTTCLRGCIQCVYDETGKPPDEDAHTKCLRECVNRYNEGPDWDWYKGILISTFLLEITNAIVDCIKQYSPNKGNLAQFAWPPPQVDCVDGKLILPKECQK